MADAYRGANAKCAEPVQQAESTPQESPGDSAEATNFADQPNVEPVLDPNTGYLLDPVTGWPLDPETGAPINPATLPEAGG